MKIPVLPNSILKYIIETLINGYNVKNHTHCTIKQLDRIFYQFSMACQRWMDDIIPTVEFNIPFRITSQTLFRKFEIWVGLGIKFSDVIFTTNILSQESDVSLVLRSKVHVRSAISTMNFANGYVFLGNTSYSPFEFIRKIQIDDTLSMSLPVLLGNLFPCTEHLTTIHINLNRFIKAQEHEDIIGSLNQLCNKFIYIDDISIRGSLKSNEKITEHLYKFPNIIQKLKSLHLIYEFITVHQDLNNILTHPFSCVQSLKLHKTKNSKMHDPIPIYQSLLNCFETHHTLTVLSLHFADFIIDTQHIQQILKNQKLKSLKLKFKQLTNNNNIQLYNNNNSITVLTLNFAEANLSDCNAIVDAIENLNSFKLALRLPVNSLNLVEFNPKRQFYMELVIPYQPESFDIYLDSKYSFHKLVNNLTVKLLNINDTVALIEHLYHLSKMIRLDTLYLNMLYHTSLLKPLHNNTNIKNLILVRPNPQRDHITGSKVIDDLLVHSKNLLTIYLTSPTHPRIDQPSLAFFKQNTNLQRIYSKSYFSIYK
ncbi:hypothetical protein DLAC_05475 [Tieghemostelium lacteum]|uniref:Uncharacterized protein n=1 Tax=Tieghemostelium lacteum TaxID=361077 RepID=A0A151ZG31_TIELA|nr:hypothetical protein DLAC_05475 [Tieghemostelium lacteum]|eukprot:KYQ92885.1 hypothetical protein DLAC_05475 [Tieghemostelium lacteum]